MPKYYITDGCKTLIIDRPSAENAATEAVLRWYKPGSVDTKHIYLLVGEEGFGTHVDVSMDNQQVFSAHKLRVI